MQAVSKVHIQNYRSIENLWLDLGPLTTLVGANNSGKTNILSALHLLLGPRWPILANLSDTDFFARDTTRELKIQVWFSGGDVETIWLCYDRDDREGTGLWYKYRGGANRYKLSNKARDACPLIYLGADRNFERQFGATQWTLFGQAITQLHNAFVALDDAEAEARFKELMTQAGDLLKVGSYPQFEAAFRTAFTEQVRNTSHRVEVDFRTFTPLNFYKTLQPVFHEDGIPKDPAEAGAGMRNLMLLALFRAAATISKGSAVMVVEEPEIYLHPHAQRSLATMFRELADSGTQILLSTHSASFISAERFDELAIVERVGGGGERATRVRRATPVELLSLTASSRPGTRLSEAGLRERYRHLCGLAQAEAMFSRVVVLVEGASEVAALDIFARHMGHAFDALGVTVIDCEGKDNLDTFYHLYTALGFPTYVVFDNDSGEHAKAAARAAEKPALRDKMRSIEAANERLTGLFGLEGGVMPPPAVGEKTAVLNGDFETTMQADLEAVRPGLYAQLRQEAGDAYGGAGKPATARYVAERVKAEGIVPATMQSIIERIVALMDAPAASPPSKETDAFPW